jgi:hypothetical protein
VSKYGKVSDKNRKYFKHLAEECDNCGALIPGGSDCWFETTGTRSRFCDGECRQEWIVAYEGSTVIVEGDVEAE